MKTNILAALMTFGFMSFFALVVIGAIVYPNIAAPIVFGFAVLVIAGCFFTVFKDILDHEE